MKAKVNHVTEKQVHVWGKVAIVIIMIVLAVLFDNNASSAAAQKKTISAAACQHEYEWVTVLEPTCTKAGKSECKCKHCGFVSRGQEIPMVDHSWNKGSVTTAATCTSTGTKTFKCTVCGKTKTESIKALGHDYQPKTISEATCAKAGKVEDTCTRCGHVIRGYEIAKKEHTWNKGTVTKAATCTATGTRTYKCKVCGETKTETISKTAHDYQWVVVIKSTCTTGGKEEKKCTVCGYSIDGHETPSNGGHSWQVTSVKDPTCTTTGATNYKCTKCGETKSESIPAQGHSYQPKTVLEATCAKAGKVEDTCIRCGHVIRGYEIAKKEHTWDSGTVTKAASCTATGTRTYKCKVCGETKSETISKTEHNYQWVVVIKSTCTSGGKEEKKCTVCGYAIDGHETPSNGGHNWQVTSVKNPTCTTNGATNYKCTKCGETKSETIPAPGHNYQTKTVVPSTCAKAGKAEDTCTRCGHVAKSYELPIPQHSWNNGTVTTVGDCGKDEVTTYKCSVCGTTKTVVTKSATGNHNYQWKTVQAPTCTKAGKEEKICTVCGIINETREIGCPGHRNCKWTTVSKPTGTSVGKENYVCSVCMTIVKSREVYLVSYDANGGSGAPSSQIKSQGVAINLSSTVQTRSGYTFIGWSTSATSATASYTAGTSYTVDKNTTLYAVWQGGNCYVVFDANGGSGTVPSKLNVKRGGTVEIPKSSLSRNGYYFLGWSTSKTATAAVYKGGSTLTLNNSITLYAVWQARMWTLTFDKNGGSGSTPAMRKVTHGKTVAVGNCTLKRDNYYFMGWAEDAKASSAKYNSTSSIVMTKDLTLYAVWKPQTYRLTFSANNGTGSVPATISATYGSNVVIPKCSTVKRSGYYFLGWATSSSNAKKVYKSGMTFQLNTNVTLYAVWQQATPEKVTLTFKANGGESAPSTIPVNVGTPVSIPSFTMKREGFWFKGWALKSTATKPDFTSKSDPFKLSENMTLYAVWEKATVTEENKITITFNVNGGDPKSAPNSICKPEGTEVTIPTYKGVREGFWFKGWATAPTATEPEYTSKTAPFKLTKNMTLYAVWTKAVSADDNKRTITFNMNGWDSKNAPEPITVTKGTYVKIPYYTAKREGFTFKGWAVKNEATVPDYLNKSDPNEFELNENMTLYAVWTEHTFNIGFSGNSKGVQGIPGGKTKYYTKDLVLPSQKPTLSGYTFVGWAESPTATTAKWTPGQSLRENRDITLYAVWVKKYTISYYCNGGSVDGKAQFNEYCTGDTQTLQYRATAAGYTFAGWTVENSRTNLIYSENDTLKKVLEEVGTEVDTINLQAVWCWGNPEVHLLGTNKGEVYLFGMNTHIYIPRSRFSELKTELANHKGFTDTSKDDDITKEGVLLETIRNVLYYRGSGYRIDDICMVLTGMIDSINNKTDYLELLVYNDIDGISVNEIKGNLAVISDNEGTWYDLASFENKLKQLIANSGGAKISGFDSFITTESDKNVTVKPDGTKKKKTYYGVVQNEILNDPVFIKEVQALCDEAARYQMAMSGSATDPATMQMQELAIQNYSAELWKHIKSGICGAAAAASVYLYLEKEEAEFTYTDIRDLLIEYMQEESDWEDWITRAFSSGDGWWSVTDFLEKKMNVSASSGFGDLGRFGLDDFRGQGYKNISKMLSNDIPVIMAFLSREEELRFLDSSGNMMDSAGSHFFVVTGFLESSDGLQKYIRVATSWESNGKDIGYINWYEFAEKANRGFWGEKGTGYITITKK